MAVPILRQSSRERPDLKNRQTGKHPSSWLRIFRRGGGLLSSLGEID